MEELIPVISLRQLAWAPVWQTAALLIGTFLSFMVAYSHNTVSVYFPFFSETGAHPPEICIFSYTLIFGSFFGLLVVFYRYAILKHIIAKESTRLRTLNVAALCCGTCSMIGLAGVAAIPMSTVYLAHLAAAGIHFLFAMCFIFLQTYLSFFIHGGYTLLSKIRLAIFVSLLVFLVTLVILFPLSHREWRKENQKPPALKVPGDIGFALLLSSSLFEWLLYITFILFMLSFIPEFNKFQIHISVSPKE